MRRHGIAAVLAMLYLVLFSALALGFYAATSMSVQVVGNDQRTTHAQLAAESGMDFLRYHMRLVHIPPGTAESELFRTLALALEDQLSDTGNITSITYTNSTITIPATGYVRLDSNTNGPRFRAVIYNLGEKVRVKITGEYGDSASRRAVQMEYGLAENASAIFDYGVASKGKITTGGHAKIRGATDPRKGSVLSTNMTDPTPVSISGDEVSGDISITNPAGNIYVKPSSSIAGSNNPHDYADNLHIGVPEPEFPTIDSSAFRAFATNTFTGTGTVSSNTTLVNARIPANANVKFTGNVTIQGVLYIEAPNNIEFGGNANVQGVIVVPNDPAGSISTNSISFQGNVTSSSVSTLPDSFGDLKKLTGSFLLAPEFKISFSGNFGTINGSVIAGQIAMTGNAEGTIMGSIIGLEDVPFEATGSSEIIIASTGTTNYPAGVFFSSHYAPLADTYSEVRP